MTLHPIHLNFLIYEENLVFCFISVPIFYIYAWFVSCSVEKREQLTEKVFKK